MLIPVTSNDQSIGKLSTGYLTLEVWDKINPAKDELLGLVKLPLKSFATALSSGTVILINSVYPLIAIDEFCAINNLRSGKDVGYLRVCLAMGTPAQVHRLHLSQTNHIRETPISAKTKKYEAKAQETETLVDSKTKNAFELVEEKKPRDWEQENLIEIQKDLKMISESAESIGDLAAFLNPKPVEEIKSEIEKPIKKLEISSAVKSIEISPEKSRLELIEFIKARLSSENVNLEEELKITDRFNHRYVHSDSFAHLLTELRIGIPAHDITQFINLLITENASSTHRRILFMDIFKALDIKPNYSNTKHTFAVTIKEMFNCNFMGKLQNKSSFIKYLFPKEESYLESELLENNSNIQINMNSVHSFTLAKDSDISECFTDSDEGIVIYLCKNVNRSEEQIIAKAVLPIEELADLEKGKRITRVVCLYGDRSTTVDTYLNEFVGKIRLSVEYSQDMTFEDVGKSTELVYERHTQIDRILPRHNTLSIYIENIGGLDKGQKYLRNLGIDTDSKVKLIVSIFFEDDKLAKEFGVIEVEGHSFSDNIVIKEKSQTEITLNDEILSYLKNRSAFVKFMILSNSGDEITMATTKISLISLLINSSISGEFPLLNEYGQFMGFVNMGLSFQIDDTRPVSPELVESDMPQSPSLEQLPTLTILEDVSKIQLNLESAMYLPKQLNGEFPNAYIQFKWFDSQLYKTPPVLRSSNPS